MGMIGPEGKNGEESKDKQLDQILNGDDSGVPGDEDDGGQQ